MTKRCPECEAEINPSTRTCSSCGYPISKDPAGHFDDESDESEITSKTEKSVPSTEDKQKRSKSSDTLSSWKFPILETSLSFAAGLILGLLGTHLIFPYGFSFNYFHFRTHPAQSMKWQYRDVQTDDPDYPLKVKRDGYKLLNFARDSRSYDVEWGWKIVVENIDSENYCVEVDYTLEDEDEFEFVKDTSQSLIGAGETETIQGKSVIDASKINSISRSGWYVSYSEPSDCW